MKRRLSLVLALALCLVLGAPALAADEPALPDPAAWLGSMAKQVETGRDELQCELVTCELAEGAANAVMGYLDLLLDARFHLELTGKITTNWGTLKHYGFRYTGDSGAVSTDEHLVSVQYGRGKLELHYPTGFILTDGGDRFDPSVSYQEPDGYDANAAALETAADIFGELDATPVPTSAPVTPAPTAASAPAADSAAVSGPVIPDAWAFFNQEVTHEDEKIENGTRSLFQFDPAHAAAAYEYVELLQNGGFGLTLTDTFRRDRSQGGTYHYIFDCPGRDVAQIRDHFDGAYRSGAVILQINDWPDYGWCDVVIRFSEDLTVTDAGDRSSVTGLADRMEALSGPMGGKGPRSGDADYTMRVGESLQLDCPRRFGANTEQFRWAVDEGADLVSLTGEISASATVTALAPGRVVVSVVYDHSYDTTDILTGNPTYGFDAPTYYFIIEIT